MSDHRLLVVDDNGMNREMLRRRLARIGYTVSTAAGGAEALAFVSAQRVDAVLLDIEMPEVTGIDVLRTIRATRSPSQLPIIMVSARRDSEMIAEALRLGANDYITKPVDFLVARARLEAQLARARQEPSTDRHPTSGLLSRGALAPWWAVQPLGQPAAVIWLNLDRFRAVNNGLGRQVGDDLLAAVGARLRLHAPPTSRLAHFDADNFVLVFPGGTQDLAAVLATRLLEAIRPPFTVKGQAVALRASAGVACGVGLALDDLLQRADAALYRAKSLAGDRWVVFDEAVQSRVVERLRLETDLQEALAAGALDVRFQPIFQLGSGTVAGFEVLARWHHPTRGEVPPSAFIALAEQTGLIVELGAWVLRRTCRQVRQWQEAGLLGPAHTVAVNVSGLQLQAPGFVEAVARELAACSIDPRILKIEITESVLLEDYDGIAETLRRLRKLGIAIALDDFGTGYSSLSCLQRLAMDTLKLDRSFVARLMAPDGGSAVVRAILEMAHALGLDVVAEGIESADQIELLRGLGCELGQGHLLSPPVAAEDAAAILAASRAPLRAASSPVPAGAAATVTAPARR